VKERIKISNWQDAVIAILSGVGYLWKNKRVPTLMFVVAFGGQNVLGWYRAVTAQVATFQKAEPLQSASPAGFNFQITEKAYAGGERGPRILINGKDYGIYDTNYVVWKIKDKSAMIVYNKQADEVAKISTPSIELEDFLYIKGAQRK